MKANRIFIACVAAVALSACGGSTELAASLSGAAEKPNAVSTPGSGNVTATVDGNSLEVEGSFKDLTSTTEGAHIHGPADDNSTAPIFCNLSIPTGQSGTISAGSGAGSCGDKDLTDEDVENFENGRMYVNIHTSLNKNGELRGNLKKKED